jgi:hypothetical protein
VLVLSATLASAQQPSRSFVSVGSYRGVGAELSSTVGPGKVAGSDRFYATFGYSVGGFDVLSIDPDTGKTEVFHSPVDGDTSAWSLAVGPHGNVFLGTSPTAHFIELDTKKAQLLDRGRPSPVESYIFDATFGPDNRLYGATFPRCKLVRYDPNTGRMEDLGRMDPTEEYARFIVASSDGFIYVGIGSSKANIAAYNIRTGEHREILPADAQVTGFAKVFHGQDGKVYGMVRTREFRLDKWTATELTPGQTVAPATTNTLRDGRTVDLSDISGSLTLTVTNLVTHEKVQHAIPYQGKDLALMRIGFGPGGVLYGSTAVPMDLVRADIGLHRVAAIGRLGAGEVYSFLSRGQSLLVADYSGPTTLMSYVHGVPFQAAAKTGNPRLVPFKGDNTSWRPMAMINGPDENVYVGSVGGYGLLSAPLIKWNTEDDSIQQFSVVYDQSIISLTAWHEFVIGGSSIFGGEGSHTTQPEAHLFFWNTKTQRKEFETSPVPGAPRITDLITAPNGLIYGIAGTVLEGGVHTLFVFDPEKRRVITRQKVPFSSPIYNSVGIGKDGRIWGLAAEGIFAIDTTSNKVEMIAQPPVKITGGFALRDGGIYFISDTTIYLYEM